MSYAQIYALLELECKLTQRRDDSTQTDEGLVDAPALLQSLTLGTTRSGPLTAEGGVMCVRARVYSEHSSYTSFMDTRG